MKYEITDGSFTFQDHVILSHIQFVIKGKQKAAICGRNGAGKTTLLRIIAGECTLDRDDKRQGPGILCDKDIRIRMLHQSREGDLEQTAARLFGLEKAEADENTEIACAPREQLPELSDEYAARLLEADRLLTGFGFQKEDKFRLLKSFSGGEQTKIELIRLLLEKPDLLLLDEPTNHLDTETVSWLETYLKEYDRAVLIVSHDRYFLDRTVELVWELENGKLTCYHGGYTDYRREKQKKNESLRKAYERQQEEIREIEELIERFKNKPRKAAFARSRKKILERMERIEKPAAEEAHIFTGELLPPVQPAKYVLEAEHCRIGYDTVLAEIGLRIRRGQKIGIIGPNGSGKSTFLKTAAGLLPPLSGSIRLGNRTEIGYFDQNSAELSGQSSVLEHFCSCFPAFTQKEARSFLADFLFSGKMAAVKTESLSGGEKARLLLAELLCACPNFLLLDEPTNHMDIPAKETLESAFRAYQGTLLFISHDRYFISRTAEALLVFERDEVLYYPFGYDHYMRQKEIRRNADPAALIRAEDQAMLESLRSVPKAERIKAEPDTRYASADWDLRLAKEDLEEAERQAEYYDQQYRSLEEDWDCPDEKKQQLAQRRAAVWDNWTKACISYDELFTFYDGNPEN